MQANIRQIKIKNCPNYLFNDNMIANIKDFDFSLLEISKLSFKSVFSLNIYYIKYIPTKSPNRVSIDTTDKDKDFLYLFLDDIDGHIEENNGIRCLVFTPIDKSKEALRNYKKLWEETKRQIEVISVMNQLNTEKTLWKWSLNQTMTSPWVKYLIFLRWWMLLCLFLKKMVNIIRNFFTWMHA